jgi:hypothetical protein
LCGEFEQVEEKYSQFHGYFKEKYLTSNYPNDFSWNCYETYIFETEKSEDFMRFKEEIELDLQMSRKYVLTADEHDLLPPLHMEIAEKETKETELPWEEEWKIAIGEELYDKIMDAPKSRIESVLEEYLNDKVNQTK